MKHQVVVEWSLTTILEIEADSLDEAIELANEKDGPQPDGDYINGSYTVVWDATILHNPKEST